MLIILYTPSLRTMTENYNSHVTHLRKLCCYKETESQQFPIGLSQKSLCLQK